MTHGFREENASFQKKSLLAATASAATAAVAYAITLADYAFPGESAHMMAQWTGLDALSFPEHPLWGMFIKLFGTFGFIASMAVRVNLLSLVCGVASAYMLCRLVSFLVWQTVYHEDCIEHSGKASILAGIFAAVTFTFSTTIWQSATHLECRIFDVTWALLMFTLVKHSANRGTFAIVASVLVGAGLAVGVIESPIFVPLFFICGALLILTLIKNGNGVALPLTLFLVSFAVGWFIFFNLFTGAYLATDAAATAGYKTSLGVFTHSLKEMIREMRSWTSRSGWLAVVTLTILPAVACAFGAVRGLNNERRWSQYAFHVAMTFCVIVATVTPLSPEALLRPYGIPPVATTTLVALVAGYLAAYWYLLAKARLANSERAKEDRFYFQMRLGKRVAPIMLGVFGAMIALSSIVNAFSCTKNRGEFADVCANEIIDNMKDRTWFVTDGTLDDHLRIAAASKGRELNLICLHRDMNDAYLTELANLVEEKGLKAGRANLKMTVQLGVLPFIQDWFTGDTNIINEAAIFGVPDFWYMAERMPLPDKLFFGGVRNMKEVDGKKLAADFAAFWEKMGPVLWTERNKKGSRAMAKCDDPVVLLRLQLRRHMGFVGNNLGVFLQDIGLNDEAFKTYELVLKDIDPDNVCALFNEFEMARAGVKMAVAHKLEIERAIKAIIDDPKRRYVLWSLSRYYGYIRNPEIFARMGYAWARSGQTGNAIAQVQRAIDFIPADKQSGLLNMMAAIYASNNQGKKSRQVYEQVLSKDASNHDALMGLARLSLQSGALDSARSYLEKAAKTAGKDSLNLENVLLHMMNNKLDDARMAMQKITDMHPKSLQAWSLLAGVLLQQADQAKDEKSKAKIMDELENVILAKMDSVSTNPRDYFVQMTRAMILMRKGAAFRKQARDALVIASMERPDVTVTGDMILNLDISMDDGESAEKHARAILRRDRHDKLANYVMGSLRLREGDYLTAETYLRTSVDSEQPLAAALNDLAEVLRREQNYEEAEKHARAAVKTQPNLYVAWETLGSTLLDEKKNLDEAEECVEKAISLSKTESKIEDIRMQITLARVQIAKGDIDKARSTLRTLRKRQSELSNYDRDQLEKLIKTANLK